MTYETKNVHISTINPGATIVHNGVLTTVSKSNITRTHLFGTSLFGDSYHIGHKPVILVFNLQG